MVVLLINILFQNFFIISIVVNLGIKLLNHEEQEPYHKTLTFTWTKNIFEEPTSLEALYPTIWKTYIKIDWFIYGDTD